MHEDDDSMGPGDNAAKLTRDARGRWLPKHCPNPNGRRGKKKKRSDFYPGDMHIFANTLVDVASNGRVETMNRETALLNKMFESAMKGRVSMQRFLYNEFKVKDERLAALRVRYDQLMIKWVIENPDFDGLDSDNIPFEVRAEIEALEALLSYYFPTQYRCHRWPDGDDDPY